MGRACSTDGEERIVYRGLVRKPEGKRPLGRPRRWWEDNIRIDLQEVGCGGMDWIGLAQDKDRSHPSTAGYTGRTAIHILYIHNTNIA
jgi:hypothetical protein